jgi:hypothetical protein
MNQMKQLMREPLLHFLLLGAVIFAAYSLVSPNSSGEGGQIVITRGQLASMWESFTATRQRTPTADEWEGLIRARVREEVYYREALALGLDEDDAIIRRRLQQKIEFVTDDVAPQAEATDADLRAFLQAHPERFRVEPRFTFRQVYLDPEKHGANLSRDAAQLLATLNRAGAGTGFAAMGDSTLLARDVEAMPAGEVSRQFGGAFAAKLGELQAGQWQGPIESAFGVHLVFVSQRLEGRVPALAEVRDTVRREWNEVRRLDAKEKSYGEMLARYTVTVEPLEPVAATVATTKVP